MARGFFAELSSTSDISPKGLCVVTVVIDVKPTARCHHLMLFAVTKTINWTITIKNIQLLNRSIVLQSIYA